MNFLGLVSFSALLVLIHRLGLMACKSAPWTKQVWLALISFSSPVLEPAQLQVSLLGYIPSTETLQRAVPLVSPTSVSH